MKRLPWLPSKMRGSICASVLFPEPIFPTMVRVCPLGSKDASQEEIHQAVQDAGLEADLDRFPDGLETIVGERGVSLSGGQKQRIALARALLKHPKILVLDDAFSSLDAETEALIFKQIKQTIREVTTVIITHRLSISRQADQIVVLDGGEIVERGTP